MRKNKTKSFRFLVLVLLVSFTANLALASGLLASKTVKIKCSEMTCLGCKKKITESIKTLDGIIKVKVNLDTKIVTVTYDDSKTAPDKIINAISEAGYESELLE